MGIEIREVTGKRDLRHFIHLPARLHAGHANWVPPIYLDDHVYFNPRKNRAFSYCDTVMYLAWCDGRPVGRIMGIINKPYNEIHNERHARFCWMESENDPAAYAALMGAVENWAREKGMTHLVGPLAFSDKDPQGFLIEGYGEPVEIATNYNFPYMVDLTRGYGFSPKVDLVVYKVLVDEVPRELFSRVAERHAARKNGLKVLEFTSRRKVKPFIHKVLGLVNETYTHIYGFQHYSLKEMDDIADRFLYLINPRYIKVVVNEPGEVVAFVLGMSDISEGIRRAGGRLLPFGWIHVLLASRRSKQLNLLLGAIRPDYRGRGLDMRMGAYLLESAIKTGKTIIDSHLMLEHNGKMRAEMDRVGGEIYKRFRIFIREL